MKEKTDRYRPGNNGIGKYGIELLTDVFDLDCFGAWIRRRFDAVALLGPMVWPSRAANPNMLFPAGGITPPRLLQA